MKATKTIPLFLKWVKTYRKFRTHIWYRDHLLKFQPFLGDLELTELRAYHLSDYISSHTWSDTYKSGAITAIKRWGNWLVEREYLEASPFAKVKKPPIAARNNVPTEADIAEILSKAKGPSHDLLTVLLETGARPFEIRRARVSWFKENKLIVPLHIAKRGKARKILLNEKCRTIVSHLCFRRGPNAYIFLNHRGRPWTQGALTLAMQRFSNNKFSAYDLRHYFATHALEKGVDSLLIGHLMGHADVSMIAKIYGKPREKVLQQILEDLTD